VPRIIFVVHGHNIKSEWIAIAVLSCADLAGCRTRHSAAGDGSRRAQHARHIDSDCPVDRNPEFIRRKFEIETADSVGRLEPVFARRDAAIKNLVVSNRPFRHGSSSPPVASLEGSHAADVGYHLLQRFFLEKIPSLFHVGGIVAVEVLGRTLSHDLDFKIALAGLPLELHAAGRRRVDVWLRQIANLRQASDEPPGRVNEASIRAWAAIRIPTVGERGDRLQLPLNKWKPIALRFASGDRPIEYRYTRRSKTVVRQRYLLDERILSPAQIDRMKGTELFAELLMSIHNGGPVNKKTSLDRAIGNASINLNTLHKLSREFVRTTNLVRRMFPDIRQTRFHNSVEFYTLFLYIWESDRDGLVLTDKRRNRIAMALLRQLSNGVDELRDQLRKARPAKPAQRMFSDYLTTVQGDTDSSANRERRRQVLRNLLSSLYERKDDKRTFTPEQRRIVWNSEEKKACASCRRQLRWDDFTVDHIAAWIRGGKTSLKNAQLMCRSCNSRKGAR